MQSNVLNLARAKRRRTEKKPDGSRQVVYQAGKPIALSKFTELSKY